MIKIAANYKLNQARFIDKEQTGGSLRFLITFYYYAYIMNVILYTKNS